MRHSSRWIALLLSVVSAACGESPTEPPPPEQIRVLRFWQHNTYRLAVGYFEGAWDYRLGGEVFDQVVYGGMILHPPGRDSIARGEVFSNETGHTYWVSTQTPTAQLTDTGAVIGTEALLQQHHRFRKTEPNAWLEFEITGLTLEAMDDNAGWSACRSWTTPSRRGLVLTNLSTDNLPVIADGPFAFSRQYPDGFVYNVRVDTQPTNPGQLCSVTNGSGTVDGADVTDIEVTCETLPTPDDGLDASFGVGGTVTLDVAYTGVQGDAPDVALQGDGKIVAVSGNTLVRYNPDGSLDAGFGTGGEVTVDFYGSSYDRLNAVALQPDGRIVVAGYSKDGVNSATQEDFILARYETDGTLDTSFGTGGKVVTDFEEHQDIAWDLLIQSDDRIVATGHASTIDALGFGVYYPDFAAARYSSTGELDPTFGTAGMVTTNIAGDSDFPYASALQSDGMIVLAGRVAPSGGANPDIGVLRYTADGELDTSFGNAGILRNPSDAWDQAHGVLIQPDGRIVVVGFTLHEGGILSSEPDTLTLLSPHAPQVLFG
jgi:uncharacterized delta-60 repeat protein